MVYISVAAVMAAIGSAHSASRGGKKIKSQSEAACWKAFLWGSVAWEDLGRLSGRHRQQAGSHRKAKADRRTPTLFTTQQAER
jgi:hypothetical protein